MSTLAEYTAKVKDLVARGGEHALNASELAELSFFKAVGAALAQAVVDPHAGIRQLNGTINELRNAGFHAELPPLDDLTDEASQALVDAHPNPNPHPDPDPNPNPKTLTLKPSP